MSTTITQGQPDARSTEAEFRSELISLGALSSYRGSYATDFEYERYGFRFLKTEADIDAFMEDLDRAATTLNTSCAKAHVLRSSMKAEWPTTSTIDKFKALAARSRRTHCACHQRACFAPNPETVERRCRIVSD